MEKSLADLCLGSPAKIRILSTLSAWKGKDLTERQMAALAGISSFGVRHALGDLESAGIVTKTVLGKAHIWRLNEAAYAYSHIAPIIDQIRKIPPSPLDFIKEQILSIPKDGIQTIILFGSAVRSPFGRIGDIDVAIVLKKKAGQAAVRAVEENLADISGTIGIKIGKRLEPHVFTAAEWSEAALKPLGKNILAGERIYSHEKH